uniref:Uncharacterized protein n=1 Tax=Magnetococcus massalia (strain MO-1) TaxID=451514 RepID=A0A1S7LFU6_MAGMO|nr:conserved protein of unknown function [Candidatus Magnetococcus massalia]
MIKGSAYYNRTRACCAGSQKRTLENQKVHKRQGSKIQRFHQHGCAPLSSRVSRNTHLSSTDQNLRSAVKMAPRKAVRGENALLMLVQAGVVAIGGLYYLGRESVRALSSTVQENRLSSVCCDEQDGFAADLDEFALCGSPNMQMYLTERFHSGRGYHNGQDVDQPCLFESAKMAALDDEESRISEQAQLDQAAALKQAWAERNHAC